MRGYPRFDWKTIQQHANEVLGEDFWQEIAGAIPNLGPRIDVIQTIHDVMVVVELPGLRSINDVHLSVNGSVLHIKGEILPEYSTSEENIIQSERFLGSFHRKITLPSTISYESIKAKYRKGLLYIYMKKTNESKEKRIKIETQES